MCCTTGKSRRTVSWGRRHLVVGVRSTLAALFALNACGSVLNRYKRSECARLAILPASSAALCPNPRVIAV